MGSLFKLRSWFVAVPKTFLKGLLSTVTALPYANNKTEVPDSPLSVAKHTWAIANEDKLSNER